MAERILRTQKDGNLAWLDLEMTGLDAQNDVILQAALIITNSELTRRVRASKLDLAAAERKLMERVTGWCAFGAILCGNSIGQDKRFVDRWLPGLSGYLSYRTVDVTSIKILAKLWYGDAGVFSKPTQGEHDALVDIKNSIAELSHYRSLLFKAKL